VVKLSEGRLGARGVGNGGKEECGEEGRASHSFIEPEGGVGRPNGEGDRAGGGGGINAGRPVRWGGETKGRAGGEEGGCDAVFERGGDARAVRARARGGAGDCTIGFSRRKKAGRGPHDSERRGWRRLGQPEAKARWGGRPVAGRGEREAAQEGRRGVGRWQNTRAGRKKERRPGRNHFSG
jgi:hypothetical protein